mmetsp:Transcript_39009/g.117994  ORF Transcript_39009/g.117994 Transcript_39009/m.117994 type:complete len:467 (+) Transcript_39009:75-1475(+)
MLLGRAQLRHQTHRRSVGTVARLRLHHGLRGQVGVCLPRHLQVRRALPSRDAGGMVVVVRQARRRLVHPPRREVCRRRRRWGRRLPGAVELGGHERLNGGAREGLLRRALTKLALVLRKHHLASAVGPRQGEHSVRGVLGVAGLLRRREGDEGPVAPWVRRLGVEVHVNDLAVLGKLRSQRHIRDGLRQGAHEDLPRALRLRHGGGIQGGHGRGSERSLGGDLMRDGLLAEHALVPRQRDLTGLVAPREHQLPVCADLGGLGLLRRSEGDEAPLAARLDRLLVQVHIQNLSVLGELGPQVNVRDGLGQGPNEDLPRSRRGLGDGVVHHGRSTCVGCHGVLHHRVRGDGHGRGLGDGVLAEHALVLGHHHVARAVGARKLQEAVGGVLGPLGLLRHRERDEGPLSRGLAALLHEHILDGPVLAELRPERGVLDAVRQRAHEELAACHVHADAGESRVPRGLPTADHL